MTGRDFEMAFVHVAAIVAMIPFGISMAAAVRVGLRGLNPALVGL
ncbi:hypothetical protein [Bradyrhizobium australiense]|nr:hypothetical protein [Bradyrhizobium australiense]